MLGSVVQIWSEMHFNLSLKVCYIICQYGSAGICWTKNRKRMILNPSKAVINSLTLTPINGPPIANHASYTPKPKAM